MDVTADTSRFAHVLWFSSGGQMITWTVYDLLDPGFVSGAAYGPYPGWTAKTIARGADGAARVLWQNMDGSTVLWVMDSSFT